MELIANPISNAATKVLEQFASVISQALSDLFTAKVSASSDDELTTEVESTLKKHEIISSSLPAFFLATGKEFSPLLYDSKRGDTSWSNA